MDLMPTATVAQHLGYESCESSPLTALAHLEFGTDDGASTSDLLLEDAPGELEGPSTSCDGSQFGPASLHQYQMEHPQHHQLAEPHYDPSPQQHFSSSCSPLEHPHPSFTLQPSYLAQAHAHLQLEHEECPSSNSLHQLDSLHPSQQDQALFRYHAEMTECLRRTSTCSSVSSGSSGTTAYSMQQPSQTSSYGECEGTSTYFSQSPSPPAVEYAQSPYRPQANTRPVYYHTPGIARYGCTFYDCDWATDRRDLLRQHLEHHARQAIFNCPVQGCYKHFAILENLQAHQFEEHPLPLQSSHSLAHLHYASPTPHLQYLPHATPAEYNSDCYQEAEPHLQYAPAGSTVGLGLVHDFNFHELSLGISPGSIHPPTAQHAQSSQMQTMQPPMSMQQEHQHPHQQVARRNSDTNVYYNHIATPSSILEPSMPTLYEEETFVSPALHPSSSAALPTYPHLMSPPPAVQEEYYMYVPACAPVPAFVPTSAPHATFAERMFGNSPNVGTPVLSPNFSQHGSNLGEPLELQCNMDSYLHGGALMGPAQEYADVKPSPHMDSTFSPLRTAKARLTRASLARRGSEASYLASHPRFAAHPYAIGAGYVEPSALQQQFPQEQTPCSPQPQKPKSNLAKTRLMPGPKPSTVMPRKKSLSASSPIYDLAGNVKLHPCEFEGCDRAFKRFEHKKRHERSHTLEKPYGCDIEGCGRFFSRSDNLTQHKRTHKRNGRTQRLTQANLQYAQEGINGEDDDEEDM